MHRVGLLSTAYLPPVSYFTVMAKYGAVSIEACENFQKQSYRTRARIASSSGAEFISVPILKGEGHKRPISEIEIDYKRDWVLSHKRALMSCYGSAPFYIYYKDDIFSVLDSRPRFLLDLNTSLTRVLAGLLGIRCEIRFTDSYVAPAAAAPGVVPAAAASDAGDVLHTDTAFNAGATLQDSTSFHDDTVLQDDGRYDSLFRRIRTVYVRPLHRVVGNEPHTRGIGASRLCYGDCAYYRSDSARFGHCLAVRLVCGLFI